MRYLTVEEPKPWPQMSDLRKVVSKDVMTIGCFCRSTSLTKFCYGMTKDCV